MGHRQKIVIAIILLVIPSSIMGAQFAFPRASPEDGHAAMNIPRATPGLVVYGTVRDLTGAGVENISIYRSFAAYPGELIATTDANGAYRSGFNYIPGDEMVTVWAVAPGYRFEPMRVFWRHYYGYQQRECNFIAHLPWEYYFAMVAR